MKRTWYIHWIDQRPMSYSGDMKALARVDVITHFTPKDGKMINEKDVEVTFLSWVQPLKMIS